jgi:hypothetical protein
MGSFRLENSTFFLHLCALVAVDHRQKPADMLASQRSQTDRGGDRGEVKSDRESQSSGSDLRGLEFQKLAVALHIFAELARSEANLFHFRVAKLVVDAENALEAFKEGDGASAVQGELKGVEDLLLKVNQVLL